MRSLESIAGARSLSQLSGHLQQLQASSTNVPEMDDSCCSMIVAAAANGLQLLAESMSHCASSTCSQLCGHQAESEVALSMHYLLKLATWALSARATQDTSPAQGLAVVEGLCSPTDAGTAGKCHSCNPS